MRDYQVELNSRVAFIKDIIADAKADGIVFGNSGGKDCALVGILCKMACENTLGIMMPCGTKNNFTSDLDDASALAKAYGIESAVIDLTGVKSGLKGALEASGLNVSGGAAINIAPRLRMSALYAVAQSKNYLVAGTGNRSEIHMGYFTKWGDGAYDFNPVSDLTVTEIYEFLRFLNAPETIIKKAPSGGLFDGQTDEGEMGITYKAVDEFLLNGTVSDKNKAIIDKFHNRSAHKRKMPLVYRNN